MNISATPGDQVTSRLAALNNGRLVDAVVVTSGAAPAYTAALSTARAEGRIVAIGIPTKDVPISISQLTSRGLQYIYSSV